MQDYEKLRAFYLGQLYYLEQGARRDDLVIYDANDLTTYDDLDGLGWAPRIRDGHGRLVPAWI